MSKKKIYKIDKIVGQNIRRARLLRNMNQDDFAFMIGIDRTTLGSIERGISSPSQETLEKIVEVLKTKPYLLYINREKEIDIEKAHKEIIEILDKLKEDEELFRQAYDFITELSNGI